LHNFLICIKNNTIHCFLKKYWSKSDLQIIDSCIPNIYQIKWAIIWFRISLLTDEHIYNTDNLYIDIIWTKIKLRIELTRMATDPYIFANNITQSSK
jgi:hypothetical protein